MKKLLKIAACLTGLLALLFIITNPSSNSFESYSKTIGERGESFCMQAGRLENNLFYSRFKFINQCNTDRKYKDGQTYLTKKTYLVTGYLGRFKIDWEGYE